MVYSLFDRMLVGGAMPVAEVLTLESIDPLKSDFFLERREIGIFNVGGKGCINVDGTSYELKLLLKALMVPIPQNFTLIQLQLIKPAPPEKSQKRMR